MDGLMNDSVNRINESVKRRINWCTNEVINKSINQLINQCTDVPVDVLKPSKHMIHDLLWFFFPLPVFTFNPWKVSRNFFFSAAVKFDFNIGNSNCKAILKKKKKEGRKLNCWRAILFLWLLGSEWHLLITSKSANQRARKVLLNCMVCTKRWSKLSWVLDRMLSFFPESFDKDHSFYFVIVAIVTDTFVPSIFMTIVHPPPPQPSSGVTWQ